MKVAKKKAKQQHLLSMWMWTTDLDINSYHFNAPIVVIAQTQINVRAIAYGEEERNNWRNCCWIWMPSHSVTNCSSAVTIWTFTLVFIQLSLSWRSGICLATPLSPSPPVRPSWSSIIIFTSYIKIITEVDWAWDSNWDWKRSFELGEAERSSHGHPLCWRAFICQTIQQRVGYLSAPWADSRFNHFISIQHPASASASASVSSHVWSYLMFYDGIKTNASVSLASDEFVYADWFGVFRR